jgi:CheY-like chemotaxis protein
VASGKIALHPEPMDLNAAIRHVCSICGPQISEKAVHLHCDLAPDAGFLEADPARFRQVLWNLFNNAVKFTPAGKNVHISTARLPGARVRVQVRDEGIGIPAEILPRIFDAFEQGEEKITRQFGGLGLGLAICKALVELHGGEIRAESNGQGTGAVFSIELPGSATQPGAAPAPRQETSTPRLLSLLIVEDHTDTARALSRLLRRSGYMVESASDVASAVAMARAGNFDLVISDLGLPDATGYELMRQLQRLGGIKGIAMSGYGMDEDVRKSREAGFSEHLVKPVNVTRLREAIQRVTGQKS